MLRGLGVIRLSDRKDESTSPERQEEICKAAAAARGVRIVAWAKDLDVSATKYGPFDRPELGQWLTEEGSGQWDEMIFWRLDRVTRSVLDFANLIDWADKHDKNLVSATESIDMRSDFGRMIAYIVAVFAQMEARTISERVTGSHRALRQLRRWGGGMFPYGYRPESIPSGGWRLVVDPEASKIVRELVERVLAGESMLQVCRDFTARGVPTPRDYWDAERGRKREKARTWGVSATSKILRGRGILGEQVHDGEVVRDDAGLPLKRAEPIVTREEWDRLQAILDDRANTKAREFGASLLLRVAYCYDCDFPLYAKRDVQKGKKYTYYMCKTKCYGSDRKRCSAPSVRGEDLEATVEDEVLHRVGHLEVLKKVKRLAVDHSSEIADLEAALDELMGDRKAGLYRGESGTERYRKMYSELEDRLEALRSIPADGPTIELHPTGRTFAEVWGDGDTAARRHLLIESGIKVKARRGQIQVILPPDMEARIMEAARRT